MGGYYSHENVKTKNEKYIVGILRVDYFFPHLISKQVLTFTHQWETFNDYGTEPAC